MNKAKEHLAELRDYLQRDSHGTKLLDVVTRDVNEQRKRIAALEAAVKEATPTLQRFQQEKQDAETEIASLKQALETETARLMSAKKQQTELMDCIAGLEKAAEVNEEIPITGRPRQFSQTLKVLSTLSKEVRRRFKKAPDTFGRRRSVKLESVVKTFSGDEFMSLGMLMTFLAVSGFPAGVEAEETIKSILEKEGMEPMDAERYYAQFFHWYRGWMQTNSTSDKIMGGAWKGTKEYTWDTTPFTPPKK